MEVIKHQPTSPPPTFDVVGLTEEQFKALQRLVALGYAQNEIPVGMNVYNTVYSAMLRRVR